MSNEAEYDFQKELEVLNGGVLFNVRDAFPGVLHLDLVDKNDELWKLSTQYCQHTKIQISNDNQFLSSVTYNEETGTLSINRKDDENFVISAIDNNDEDGDYLPAWEMISPDFKSIEYYTNKGLVVHASDEPISV